MDHRPALWRLVASCCTLAVASFLVASTAGGTPPQRTLSWTQATPATSPPPRSGAVLGQTSPPGRDVVLFGGNVGGAAASDTWTWDGTTWTQQFPTTSPSARWYSTMAYDAATHQLVLFGGNSASGVLNDTWVWDGSDWRQLSPATSPSPRFWSTMAYDQARRQLVLFGGTDAAWCPLATRGSGTAPTGANSSQRRLRRPGPARCWAKQAPQAGTSSCSVGMLAVPPLPIRGRGMGRPGLSSSLRRLRRLGGTRPWPTTRRRISWSCSVGIAPAGC